MSSAAACMHGLTVVVASDANVFGTAGVLVRATIRWCAQCGSLRCNDGSWLEPGSHEVERRLFDLQRRRRLEALDA